MKKPALVIFEGVDKVGKTVVYHAFRKLTNYGPLCIDRFLGSNFAHDIFFNREHYVTNYADKEKQLMKIFDCVLVYLVCPEDVLKKRMIKGKEDPNHPAIRHFDILNKLFETYFNLSQFRKIIIDTSIMSIDYSAGIVRDFVESGQAISLLHGFKMKGLTFSEIFSPAAFIKGMALWRK